MKILILMPCDEQHVFAAVGLENRMPKELADRCFSMPHFMQYLIDIKKTKNWMEALTFTMVSEKKFYEHFKEDTNNIIVIGNAPKTQIFDAVFNFQDIDEALPYVDKFMNKTKTVFHGEKKLTDLFENLYEDKDSQLALKNLDATVNFIQDYLKSDNNEKLKEIKEKYLKEKEKG